MLRHLMKGIVDPCGASHGRLAAAACEALEERRLLTASATMPAPGWLRVYGSNNPDVIEVRTRVSGGTTFWDVYDNGVVVSSWQAVSTVELAGFGGNDVLSISSLIQPGLLFGGTGSDTVYGGHVNDTMHGEDGNDVLFGRSGNDWIRGYAGHDALSGGYGADAVIGNEDRDVVIGGSGADSLYGDNNSDLIVACIVDGVHNGTLVSEDSLATLNALSAEWRRDIAYTTKVSHIRYGGGLNGNHLINDGDGTGIDTVDEDFYQDGIYGGDDLDMFVVGQRPGYADFYWGSEPPSPSETVLVAD